MSAISKRDTSFIAVVDDLLSLFGMLVLTVVLISSNE